jgi:Sugar-transfer associated ATP-grasp
VVRSSGAIAAVRLMGAAKLWARLPYDGQGLISPDDARIGRLRERGAARFWRHVPRGLRWPAIAATRLASIVAAYWRVRAFALAAELDWRATQRLLGDCLAAGALPDEAFVWREVFGGRHPLPGRSAGLVLASLGDPVAHRLLADRQATAELLRGAGLATPVTYAIVARGGTADLSRLPSGKLFLKPRHGSGGCGGAAVDGADVSRRIAVLARDDDLLVQELPVAAAELSALATDGIAPVLRLATARKPGGTPFLHAAFLAVSVPGEPSRDIRRGHLRVPIDPVSGVPKEGLWFADPSRRFAHAWWNQAPLAGRRMPVFADAVASVLSAMKLLPDLALVNWDVIVTSRGPVILEGNTGGDWILSCLGVDPDPLIDLLVRWSDSKNP